MELIGKVALITGGAQGIGKAIALLLARNGADIVVTDVNLERAEETSNEIQALGRKTLALKADVSRMTEVEGLDQGF